MARCFQRMFPFDSFLYWYRFRFIGEFRIVIDGFYSLRTLAAPFRAVDPLYREAVSYRTMKPALGP